MISFYMQTFLKAVSIALVLTSQIAFAEGEPAIEEAPLVPVSGLSANKSVSEAEDSLSEEKYVLNGFSVGGFAANQSYNLTLVPIIDGATGSTIKASTADVQSVGVISRYSIIPTGSLGSDFSLALGTALNQPILVGRFEFNFGWGFLTEGKTRFYILGGFGYESINGKEIDKFLSAGGGTVQAGAGVVLSSSINLEGFVLGARHAVSTEYQERAAQAALAAGATKFGVDAKKSYVESLIISGRLIYKF